jgi:RNA 2',3'-cyclic 3'-phosphodiesterase
MRLFAGIDLPDNIVHQLQALLRALKPHGDGLRWSRVENLHVTTRFIGEWPSARLDELKERLASVPRPGPIPITLRGLGWFPNPHVPRVFWVAIDAPPELARLAHDTDTALETLGLKPEGRRFRPHLTLARINPGTPVADLRRAVAALPSREFGAFTADRFWLYRSEPSQSGSKYTQLAGFPLTD